MSPVETNFYVTGGTLRHDAPSYVERQADKDLLDGLLKGEFCYVLTSRQMGKSSLMVRTAQKLRAQGISVIALDLTALGLNLTPEQWYDGLLVGIGRQLRLEDELEQFWTRNTRLSPLQRLMSAIHDVALLHRPGPLVIFVDESDIVRSLPFSTDEFFAAIRECYNRRTENLELERLRFCLLGVATPTDLIRNTRLTPFNIGRRIDLTDFTAEEASPLARGLAQNEQISNRLLQRVLYWTGGHPYLTQRLCRAIAETAVSTSPRDIDLICRDLFLSVRARERDDNLIFVRERLLNSEADRSALLDLYGKIHKGRRILNDETNPLVSILSLSGITRGEGSELRVRNRIYARVFDREWIASNLPESEKRRQRAAFKRGAIGAAITMVLLLMLLFLPLFKEAPKSRATSSGQFTNIILEVVNGRPVIPPELLGIMADNANTEVIKKPAQSLLDLPTSPVTNAVATNEMILAKIPPLLQKTGNQNKEEKASNEVLAAAQAGVELETKQDAWAAKLRIEAQRQLDLVNAAKAQQQKYETALKNAQAAFNRKEYSEASQPANFVQTQTDAKAKKLPVVAGDESQAGQNLNLTQRTINGSVDSAQPQNSPNVVVLQMEGKVEFLRNGAQVWDPVPLDSTNPFVLHPGDRVRTGRRSRAMLRWPDLSLMRINELTTLEISAGPRKRSVIDLLKGSLYFFHGDNMDDHEIQIPPAKTRAKIRG